MKLLGAAIEVHKTIGAGLLESVYEIYFSELQRRFIGYRIEAGFISRRLYNC